MRTLLKLALNAVEDLNSDTSVPDTQTLADLEEVRDRVEGYIDALCEQIENREIEP